MAQLLEYVCVFEFVWNSMQTLSNSTEAKAMRYFANIMCACNMEQNHLPKISAIINTWKVLWFVGLLISATVLSVLPHSKQLLSLSLKGLHTQMLNTHTLSRSFSVASTGYMMTSVCMFVQIENAINKRHTYAHQTIRFIFQFASLFDWYYFGCIYSPLSQRYDKLIAHKNAQQNTTHILTLLRKNDWQSISYQLWLFSNVIKQQKKTLFHLQCAFALKLNKRRNSTQFKLIFEVIAIIFHFLVHIIHQTDGYRNIKIIPLNRSVFCKNIFCNVQLLGMCF